jgi:potassium-transporting ATPase KdpC subunit
MKTLIAEIKTSLLAAAALAVLLCGLYPLTVSLAGRVLFPGRADGSLLVRDGTIIGSSLIGRPFAGPGYFHSRPSAAGAGYDGTASGGTNLGPLSKTLNETVARRVADYREENGLPSGTLIPADAVTASASGLDPHISPQNAFLQAPRVARENGLELAAVRKLIEAHTQGRDLGLLGEPRVNVLLLNLAMERISHAGR